MMQQAFPLTLGALALSACVAPVARQVPAPGPLVLDGVAYRAELAPGGALTIAREGQAFANWEGAEARRAADQFCQGRVNSGMRDRYQGDAWVFVGGCA